MRSVQLFTPGLVLLLTGALLSPACKKNGVAASMSVISHINPSEGPGGTVVTISGTGFGATVSRNSVFFNGENASIVTASDSQLVVTVPALAGSGAIAVVANGVQATGPLFTYDYQYMVTTLAGSGSLGSTDATGLAASFSGPYGVVADRNGNVFVADYGNNKIRKIFPGGVVTTFAGSGSVGSANGTGTAASFRQPVGIAVDSNGNFYVADAANHEIRMITAAGVVTTLAGNGVAGSADGTGASASFGTPFCIAADSKGNLYVTDELYNTIRKIAPGGVVTTFAGTASTSGSSADGTGASAGFDSPAGITVDSKGNLYVADGANKKIRMITSGGVVTTLAGNGSVGHVDGAGAAATFSFPIGIVQDGKGNLYLSDDYTNLIRKIAIVGGVVTTVAGDPGVPGSADGIGPAAGFNSPAGMTIDGNGNMYVADYYNNAIRKITMQ